ncbi:MAG: hypothetical protein JO307_05180 [Bryobacterales bacterium]|nr:hypothetical protein [Bryobacterales bacterium]MBV9400206.1 hypothetical protein [Bryobacterales bacterium]
MMRVLSCVLLFSFTATVEAQLSPNAYRALGQQDLIHNGLNEVQGTELYNPFAVALDTRGGVTHIYISDVGNARILGWADTAAYQIGDPPDVVLGQSSASFTNGIGNGTLNQALGLAVDPGTGNLYVADTGNNRVLRFPSPFSNPNNFTPDAVLGQPAFGSIASGAGAAGLNAPQALAFDPGGNLWVADTGNNRILRFPSSVLSALSAGTAAQADLVLGQKDFNTTAANGGGAVSASGYNSPKGIAFDPQNNLYVADTLNFRVLRFAAPVTAGQAAGLVIGQSGFATRTIANPPTSTSMAGATSAGVTGPTGIAVTANGTLYVAIPGDNRVLAFPFGSPANTVFGQATFTTATPNLSTQPRASQNGLWSPTSVAVDGNGNAYIADLSNNRVLMYTGGSRSATKVWGQLDFISNGKNRIKATSVNLAFSMAVDYSKAPYPLYVSDTNNNRVLIWRDSTQFVTGAPADLVIGQPDLVTAIPNVDNSAQTPTATSLALPKGLALDSSGNLYVADFGNNRVLHYPRPVDQQGRITPDIVLGQPNFTTSSTGSITASSLLGPSCIAVGPAGEVLISDTGNNRVLQFLPNPVTGAAAVQVYGQSNFNSSSTAGAVSPQTLSSPVGVFLDPNYNLYVVDSAANRVLVYLNVQSIHGNGQPASIVFGQSSFSASAAGGGPTGLRSPAEVTVDGNGYIIVSDSGNSRVLVFPSLLSSLAQGTPAIYGLGGNNQNGLATPSSLIAPIGLFVDRKNTLYVGDTGNNRVVHFLGFSVVSNAAGFGILASVPVAPGSLATLKTTPQCLSLGLPCIVPSQRNTSTPPWPTTLSGWQVIVNDTLPGPVYFVGPDATGVGQVNFQVPGATPSGTNRIGIRTADTNELLAGGTLSVGNVGPGLFTANSQGTGQGSILNQDGVTVNGPTHAAPRGSVISVFATGQGMVIPPVPDGQPPAGLTQTVTVPGSDAQSCLAQNAVCVLFGTGTPVYGGVQFSGLAPGFVGLWQINVQIPSNAPTGAAVPLHVFIDGSPSNTVTMAIQ